jgi:hypothetical protein
VSPKRVHTTRSRPWRADHPDAVIVARPTPWGNPFRSGGDYWSDALGWPYPRAPWAAHRRVVSHAAHAAELFRAWLGNGDWEARDLAGKDLACWCPLDQPCHADVLLEVANGAGTTR